MADRREFLGALAALPLAGALARAGIGQRIASGTSRGSTESTPRPSRARGFACALGEQADATTLPAPRREGEFLALALAGTPRPAESDRARLLGEARSEWIELAPRERAFLDDGPLAERVRAAAGVALVPGEGNDVLEWLFALYPPRRPCALGRALVDCADAGGRIVGRGSTAFLVALGGVARGAGREEAGESRVREANPRRLHVARLVGGLGLAEDLLVDTQTRADGSLLRLLSVMIDAHVDAGALLLPRSVLCADLEARAWSAQGEDPLLFVDARGARRSPRVVEGARLSVLASGDRWIAREHVLVPSGEPDAFNAPVARLETDRVLHAEDLLAPPAESRAWSSSRASSRLRRTSLSRAWRGGTIAGGAARRAHELALDVSLSRETWGELD